MKLAWYDFELDILDHEIKNHGEDGHPYLKYIAKQFGQVSSQQWCNYALFNRISDSDGVYSYLELFGGVGFDAVMAYNLFPCLEDLTVVDLDAGCVRQLKSLRFSGINYKVISGDAVRVAGTIDADVVQMDFPYFTWYNYFNTDDWDDILDNVLRGKPDWLLFTDSAISRLHLNRDYYTANPLAVAAQVQIATIADYMRVWDFILRGRYGYWVRAYAYHSRATYILACRTGEFKGKMEVLEAPKSAAALVKVIRSER